MIKDLFKTIKLLFRLAIILSYPLIILIILGWFLIPFTFGYLREMIAFLLLTLIIIAINVLIPGRKLRYWFAVIGALTLSVLCFVKFSFYLNYGVKISASALFVIFETNAVEASDFLMYYLNVKVIGLFLLLISFFFISYIQLNRLKFHTVRRPFFFKAFSIFGIICSVILIRNRFSEENIVVTSIKSYQDYTETKTNLQASLAQHTSPNVTVTNSADDSQTYVVIIGESTSRWHMQLYGYDRETNPLLTELKEELLLFNDVITTNVHTIVALDKILTFSNFEHPNKKDNASIVQLANEAGFTTYWISNQKPVGLNESIPTLIGSAAKEIHFIASDNFTYNIFDENLLPVLDSVLNKKVKKKLIFLHLIGSHTSYSRRYPETFNYFKENKKNAKFKREDVFTLINEYDNSILYNDFVISEVIQKVKAQNTNSYVLYFADHGDEVFDTMDLAGHNEYHATKPMYEVPFFVWLSEDYKSTIPDTFCINNTNEPYILEDFIHSFGDLSRISFKELNREKSIFSNTFKPKIRRIKKGENYDTR